MLSVSSTSLSPDTLRAANISPATLLATDFLNHYNEVAMLIDLISMDPDVAEDILEWQPMSYVDHFRHSGFRDRELAIYAYENAAPELVQSFEQSCRELDQNILDIQDKLKQGITDPEVLNGKQLYDQISGINGLIVGHGDDMTPNDPTHDDSGVSQSEIDDLFS